MPVPGSHRAEVPGCAHYLKEAYAKSGILAVLLSSEPYSEGFGTGVASFLMNIFIYYYGRRKIISQHAHLRVPK